MNGSRARVGLNVSSADFKDSNRFVVLMSPLHGVTSRQATPCFPPRLAAEGQSALAQTPSLPQSHQYRSFSKAPPHHHRTAVQVVNFCWERRIQTVAGRRVHIVSETKM